MLRFSPLFAFLSLSLLLPLSAEAQKSKPTKHITLEDLWINGTYMPEFPNEFRWMKDDKYYTELEDDAIAKYALENEQKVEDLVILSKLPLPKGIVPSDIRSYELDDSESKVILTCKTDPIYRHSTKEITMVWDLKNNKMHSLQEGKKISLATFSPDGSKIAYTFDNNLYCYNFATEKSTAITTDGKWNNVINGSTDWVYEEEFSFVKAFEWSPKGDKIAYYRFDESQVREFSMDMYGELYPKAYTFKYPKAGEANAIVEVYIHDLAANKTLQADLGPEKDQYIPRIKWTRNNDVLAVMRMNRLQNKLDVLQVNTANEKTTLMLTEISDTYIDITDDKWYFLKNHPDMLWLSEQDGYNHIYRYGMDGKLLGQITSGSWEVTQVSGIDEKNDLIYYLSTEVSPLERQLYAIQLDGKNKKKITDKAGVHNVSFSSAHTYFVDSYSTIDNPGKSELRTAKDGKSLKTLVANTPLNNTLSSTILGKTEFFKFKTSQNVELNGWMIKPADFSPKKKYPVLMYVYGGPGSQTVQNDWGFYNYIWFQMLADKGYIVVSVDGRGTGARGAQFKKCTYADMGKLELQDQIEAAKYLQTLSYVDKDRIGIWGWSFGGYMTSLCMTKGGGIFKAGIAVAPVTNWRYYDSIYTERYLKTPQLNAKGYDDNSPIYYANQLQGKYLLVHGSADDNVHFQNTMEWISALVKHGKQFDLMVYPNKNHSIGGGARYHLYKKMTDFITANL